MTDRTLNAGQVNKFRKRFNLTNLRQIDGEWWADDDGEPYHISYENYWGAWHDGDLA